MGLSFFPKANRTHSYFRAPALVPLCAWNPALLIIQVSAHTSGPQRPFLTTPNLKSVSVSCFLYSTYYVELLSFPPTWRQAQGEPAWTSVCCVLHSEVGLARGGHSGNTHGMTEWTGAQLADTGKNTVSPLVIEQRPQAIFTACWTWDLKPQPQVGMT